MTDSKDTILLLFTSPADSERVRHGLALARMNSNEGKNVTIVLMQDSVLLALKSSRLSQGFEKLSAIYALDEHLKRRGYTDAPLDPRVKVIGYENLVELTMRDKTSVIGSF